MRTKDKLLMKVPSASELIGKRSRIIGVALLFVFNYVNQFRRSFPPQNSGVLFNKNDKKNKIQTVANVKRRPTTWWEDLDISRPFHCGHHRCFIPSVTDTNIGYLVSRAEAGSLVDMVNETELAFKIQSQYMSKTFFIEGELPRNVSIPTEIRSKVNAQVRNPLRVHQFPGSVGENNTIPNFYDSSSVIVQKMHAADNSSMLVHCADNSFTKAQIPTFISNVMDEMELKANLARDRYRMYNMLVEMPQLGTDLQILINNRGEVYFIDFGGHATWTEKDKMILRLKPKEELCGESFDMILDALNYRDDVLSGTWKWRERRYQRLRFKAGGLMLDNLYDSKY